MRLSVCAMAIACWAVAAAPASAQTSQRRPYRGLFGGGVGEWEQSLVFTMSFFGGYDTEALTPAEPAPGGGRAGATARQTTSSTFGQAVARLGYTLARSRVSFNASAGAGGTYYQVLKKPIRRYDGSVGGRLAIGRRTELNASHSIAYQPLQFSSAFPASGAPVVGPPVLLANDTVGIRLENYVLQASQVGLSHRLTRRIGLSVGYTRAVSTYAASDRIRTQTAYGRINIAVTRGLSVWANDSYFDSESRIRGDVGHSRGQHASFGLSFNRASALSLSRRLTLSFGVGAAAVSDASRTHIAATGNAGLDWEIGRSWTARTGYRRSVGFVELFQRPVTSDAVTAGLGGLIARRVQFRMSAGASENRVGFTGSSNGYRNYYGTAALSVALARPVALGVGYAWYRSQFRSGLTLPTGLFRRADRQSVYVFVSLWEPLFQRAGRANASR